MKESDGHFTIDSVSGIVSLARSLDREVQSMYNLTLYAHDQVIILYPKIVNFKVRCTFHYNFSIQHSQKGTETNLNF